MQRHKILAAISTILALSALTVAFVGPVASGVSRPGAAIPADFRVQSQSWVSPRHGWLLGVAPCGQTTCTTVVGTGDGGVTWSTLGTLRAPLSSDDPGGVTQIRFADKLHGWAYWPSLWATSDGGATWQRQAPPGDGKLVPTLAADADAVYALVSPCRLNQPPTRCGPASVWRTTPGSGSWTQSLVLPAGMVVSTAVLAVHGVVGYVVVPAEGAPEVVDATTDGQEWSSRPDPCATLFDSMLVDVAAISDTKVGFICVGDPGVGQATKRVLLSNDTGLTTFGVGTTPREGIVTLIASAPNGTLAVSSWGAPGSWIYRNDGSGWTTSVSLSDLGEGWNDLVLISDRIGFVVYGPAAVFPGNRVGQLWQTRDGGLTWGPA
jgi:photosystem II stability/assembly factor-like uncharacterized protein